MGRIIPYIMEHKKWLKPPTRLDTDWNHKPDILIRRPAWKMLVLHRNNFPPSSSKLQSCHRVWSSLAPPPSWAQWIGQGPGSPLLSLLKSPIFIHFWHGFWDILPPRHFGKASIFGGDSCHQMAWPSKTWWSNAVRSERLWQQLAKPKQATSVSSGNLT